MLAALPVLDMTAAEPILPVAVRCGGKRAVLRRENREGVNSFGKRRWSAEIIYKGTTLSTSNDGKKSALRTSTALHTSLSDLHRAIPSSTALASSSIYFSSDNDDMSFMICSWFSVPKD